MQPHDPTQHPRKIEVDLSEILIHSEAQDRPQKTGESNTQTPLPAFWRDPLLPEHARRLSSAEWTNIVFAVSASLIAVFCTLSTFDDLEQFRRNAYRTSTLYGSPRYSINQSEHFIGTTAGALRRQSRRARRGPLREQPAFPIQQAPSSPSTFNGEQLLNLQDPINNGITAAPLSSLPTGLPQETGSTGQGPETQPGKSIHLATRTPPARSRNPALLTSSTLSSAQSALGNRRSKIPHELKIAKSSATAARMSHGLVAATQPTNAMNHSMHLTGSGSIGAMHSIAAQNCMQMQHGMLGTGPVLGALHGLNNAGLGGGGDGHRGAHARH